MNIDFLRNSLLTLCLAAVAGSAQAQSGARPVLSAAPASTAPTPAPATTPAVLPPTGTLPAPATPVSRLAVGQGAVPGATQDSALPPAQPSALNALTVSPNYVIGADDVLNIQVWKNEQLSGLLPVRPDGKVTLPLINDILAAGYTPSQLAADITARLRKYLTDPIVDVSVQQVNSKRVFMVGEVMKPGPMPITPGMTILQAIATAGLTPYANQKNIYILRGDPSHQEKVKFDYKRAVKKGDMQGVTLIPGDTIVVP